MEVKAVRAFERGLAVLAALNRHGSASALSLSRETGLPRATVYRALKTLCDEGYVAPRASDDRFTLLLKVRSLSEGFEDEQWLGSVAAPAIFDLTRAVHWPCDVTTLEGIEMVIRETTHRFAPMSIDRDMIGRRLPLLFSSAGLAYLAFTSRSERQLLLRLLEDRGERVHRPSLQRDLRDIRARGYSIRQGGVLWPHTGTIAMPLHQGHKLIGCIAMIWMAKAISRSQGVALCAGPLREAADKIESSLRSMTSNP